jgi:hypothetical protein
MTLKKFVKISVEDYQLHTVQENASLVFDSLTASPLMDESILKDIDVVSGSNKIDHKLGRVPVGWIMIGTDAAVDLYEEDSTLPNKILVLNASGTATIKLLVF